jgi:hypothetical protein
MCNCSRLPTFLPRQINSMNKGNPLEIFLLVSNLQEWKTAWTTITSRNDHGNMQFVNQGLKFKKG